MKKKRKMKLTAMETKTYLNLRGSLPDRQLLPNVKFYSRAIELAESSGIEFKIIVRLMNKMKMRRLRLKAPFTLSRLRAGNCQNCNRVFVGEQTDKMPRFCSRDCWRRTDKSKYPTRTYKCTVCEIEYVGTTQCSTRRKFCSKICSDKHYGYPRRAGETVTKNCAYCKNDFTYARKQGKERIFCSIKCNERSTKENLSQTLICKNCQEPFRAYVPNGYKRDFCGNGCRKESDLKKRNFNKDSLKFIG